jgi:peptidyl-prolyl cis-trans isomerase B (cyclophilin B)
MPRLLLLLLGALLLLGGCGDDDDEPAAGTTTEATATATAAPAEEAGCEEFRAPLKKEPRKYPKPKGKLDPSKSYTAVVETTCGTFEIELDAERAPRTGYSFASLAKQGFFEGLLFHRIVPGFVIQGGDPQGNGQGGPGYKVVEAPPDDLVYSKGVVAMAKTATDKRGASGSQFFVVTGEDAGLPADYALLGKVTKGIEVVDRIGVVETDPTTEAPVDPVIIKSIEIEES